MDHNLVNQIFNYDNLSGKLTWKIKPADRYHIGSDCGTINNFGYRHITYKGKKYLAHRLIWFIETGNWSKYQIDHINGDKLDNRFSNLREVTNRQNSQNFKIHRNGHLVGTSFNKKRKIWESYINIDGKKVHLGYFSTQEDAHNVYLKKCNEIKNNEKQYV